jgi:hypothetical protein
VDAVDDEDDFFPAAVVEVGQIYTDLKGHFPTTSLSDKKYILVLNDYDSNTIKTTHMKKRGYKEMARTYDLLIQALLDRGLTPLLQHLDNEAAMALTSHITQQGIAFQLAPPHIHLRNAAERAEILEAEQ